MGSLQDALLESGLVKADQLTRSHKKKPAVRDKSRTDRNSHTGTTGQKKTTHKKKPADGDSSLARAYAARRKAEQAEKELEKQRRVADQEERRKRNLELDRIAQGKALNVEGAEQPRYFEHIGRVRRVLCTAEQRRQINEGALGIVSLRGRYLIVDPQTLEEYRALAPDLVPDLAAREPEHTGEDYPPVPDDITW